MFYTKRNHCNIINFSAKKSSVLRSITRIIHKRNLLSCTDVDYFVELHANLQLGREDQRWEFILQQTEYQHLKKPTHFILKLEVSLVAQSRFQCWYLT